MTTPHALIASELQADAFRARGEDTEYLFTLLLLRTSPEPSSAHSPCQTTPQIAQFSLRPAAGGLKFARWPRIAPFFSRPSNDNQSLWSGPSPLALTQHNFRLMCGTWRPTTVAASLTHPSLKSADNFDMP